MKKIRSILVIIIAFSFVFTSCFDDNDDVITQASKRDIGDFIWKAMNLYYLYQSNVPDLADDRFVDQGELDTYIDGFASPEALFENLIYDRANVDKFSWIVSDYEALEAAFAGVSKSNGMAFGFFKDPDVSSNNAYGYVRYVLPDSDAANKGITRGVIFNTVNGATITFDPATNQINSAIVSSLNQDSYSIGLATYDGATVTPTGSSTTLNKTVFTENPILLTTTITNGAHKIGYLAYNSFVANFDDQLNTAFANFQAEGVTSLVLDLRYNSGGSVLSAITLSSLITGQFAGQVFSTEEWNAKLQPTFSTEALTNNFVTQTRNGQALNSLNLNKVYVLTSGRSASASELIINGLNPYIDVVQIGTTTLGKFQASITLYDSSNFGKQNANPGHKYAIQPLVFKSLNSVGFTDYSNGFSPSASMELAEDFSNLGTLGDPAEPLLALAISDITGTGRPVINPRLKDIDVINFDTSPLANEMYIDTSIDDLFK